MRRTLLALALLILAGPSVAAAQTGAAAASAEPFNVEGIGTLTLPVVTGPEPTPGTGAYLPPVSSYRKPGQ